MFLKNNEQVKTLEKVLKRPLTEKEVEKTLLAFSGFARTLIKMKMENDKNGLSR